MVQANVKIIEDLKRFLHDVSCHAVNRAFFTEKPTDFSRKRELPMPTVVGMIVNFFKRSLAVEIQEFFESIYHQGAAPSASAFCQQRKKLKAEFFQLWNGVLSQSFYTHYGEAVKRWKRFLVLSCDGSTLYLPPAKGLIGYFGTQSNQHGEKPMARVVQLYDVLNGITLWGGICPIRHAESSVLSQHLQHLPQGSLLVLDRYFPGFALMYLLLRCGVHFVMRCRLGFSKQVNAFVRSRKCSRVVELHPSADACRHLKEKGYAIDREATIKVRLVKFKITAKETAVLITDLPWVNSFIRWRTSKTSMACVGR